MAGTVGFTGWDVGCDIGKGEYYSAGVDVVSSGLCVLVGVGLSAFGAPVVLGIFIGIGVSLVSDRIATKVKNEHYGR
jgi:hypothetical protein